jgi:hypothetical protein
MALRQAKHSLRRKSAGTTIARGGTMMDTKHLPRTCKWSTQTLLTPWPLWLDAWTNEWSCSRDGGLRPLTQPEGCRSCPRWEARIDSRLTTVD